MVAIDEQLRDYLAERGINHYYRPVVIPDTQKDTGMNHAISAMKVGAHLTAPTGPCTRMEPAPGGALPAGWCTRWGRWRGGALGCCPPPSHTLASPHAYPQTPTHLPTPLPPQHVSPLQFEIIEEFLVLGWHVLLSDVDIVVVQVGTGGDGPKGLPCRYCATRAAVAEAGGPAPWGWWQREDAAAAVAATAALIPGNQAIVVAGWW